MIQELDTVILTRDIPAEKLREGDLGALDFVHQNGAAYEVEFVTLDGETLAVVTLLLTQRGQHWDARSRTLARLRDRPGTSRSVGWRLSSVSLTGSSIIVVCGDLEGSRR
jgi:hypothetical protein